MKKIISAILIIGTVLLCGCSEPKYTAENLVQTNDENGWNCSFDSMDGTFSNGFKINSSSLRIESSVDEGSMTIVLAGNGENDTYDGSDFDRIIPSEKFGDDVLYISLKCDKAQNGRIRVVWCDDEVTTAE